MRQQRALASLVVLGLALVAACGGDEEPTGPTSTEVREASEFSRVAVEGELAVTVRLKRGAPERIEVTAPGGGHERIVTAIDGEAITVTADGMPFEGSAVLLVVPALESVSASDGATVTLVGELELPVFDATASDGASILAEEVFLFSSAGGSWQLRAEGGSTIDLGAVRASAVSVEASGRSRIAVDALTSVVGTIEPGATLEVAGTPGRVDVEGGGFVQSTDAPTPTEGAPDKGPRPDELTGAPLPALETTSVEFDEDRFKPNAGTFPALTDPELVPAADARWLDDDTLVLGATQNGEARAYPIFQLAFHHVANDTLGGKPYLVTF